jgi:CheY-like chemotaxis protein/HPt (histidine-containing phosphotransfer) domain-containing protein
VNHTGNAIKFTQQGEVVLRVGVESRAGTTLRVRFEVRDTGVGIPLEKQAQLFAAFTQADAGVARHYGGSGLGLAICKRLVDLMGGEIGVNSVEGQGSEFWFTVPLVADPLSQLRTSSEATDLHEVLVVDDSDIAREFVSKSVERLGWRAHEVSSGAAAVARVTNHVYDVLLIDWKMPEMDGMQTSLAIRALQNVPQPPIVIMVTAFGREQVLASADAAAVDAVISKPTTPSKILDAVMEARAKRQGGYQIHHRLYSPPRAVKRLLGLRILLVEDNYINQQVARGILESEGAVIATADQGALAVEVLTRRADAFDLVLMDVQMPVMDGLQATRLIRTQLRCALPIVAMSAGVTQDERALCLSAGMDAFIAKPLDPQGLIQTVRKLGLKIKEDGDDVPPPAMPTANGPRPLPRIDGVDMAQLMLALNGSREALDRLLPQFAQACEKALLDLEAAVTSGNPEAVAAVLHNLKGMATNMRATHIAVQVEALEDTLRAEGVDAVSAHGLPALGVSVRLLCDAIHRGIA